MFRLALAFVLGLAVFVSSASAQQQNSQFLMTRQGCDPFEVVLELVSGKYGEEPLFVGDGLQFGIDGQPYRGGAMFLVNQTTGSWSLVHLYGDGIACVVAVGTNFAPYSGPTRKKGEKM